MQSSSTQCSREGKSEVVIFDYIDQHIGVLDKMYQKRLMAYKQIGYEICSELLNEYKNQNSIYDIHNYLAPYKADLDNANKEIIISSPYINSAKTWELITLATHIQERGVRIHVKTLLPEAYINYSQNIHTHHQSMTSMGIKVHLLNQCHERFAIIDRRIIWYGSINLLARENEDDNIIRLDSPTIAEELLK